MAIDHMLEGRVSEAGDVLAQRFKAVEMADAEGGWSVAKHLELVPEAQVTAISQKEREQLARLEKTEWKLRQSQGQQQRRGGSS